MTENIDHVADMDQTQKQKRTNKKKHEQKQDKTKQKYQQQKHTLTVTQINTLPMAKKCCIFPTGDLLYTWMHGHLSFTQSTVSCVSQEAAIGGLISLNKNGQNDLSHANSNTMNILNEEVQAEQKLLLSTMCKHCH